jgi:hypothetical protein
MSDNELYVDYLKRNKLQVPVAKLDIDTQHKYREMIEQTPDYLIYRAIMVNAPWIKTS